MPERISAAKRLQLRNVAEQELARWRGDHAAWHKHVHNVELDSVQVLKMLEMDEHRRTIDFSCRRTGKTAVKEMHALEYNATEPDQELGIVAPREAQSIVNLNYHLDAIRRSPILTAYLAHKSGRTQMADSYYQFANRSKAQAYGIMAQVDGGDLTVASLEEVDDMPKDRLYSRFLLMMGSTRRLGASQESRNDPVIRITGVYKGADTLSDMVRSGEYHVLPTVDAYLGQELGILNSEFLDLMRSQLAPDEYIRQLLCRNVSARNLIWEAWLRRAMQTGLKAAIEPADPLPGMQYQRRGLVSLGYDHSGHGERPESSRYAVIVLEQIGNYTCTRYAREWPPGTDEKVVGADLLALWDYFRPDVAHGDAFGVGLLTFVNDALYQRGLTTIDRRTIGDGESTASTWSGWAFSPLRFEGMAKHQMASAARSIHNNAQAAHPYIDDRPEDDLDTASLRRLYRQLSNIRGAPVKNGSYSTYRMVDDKQGDDLFDAYLAAVWGLVSRGATDVVTLVETRKTRREHLLGEAPVRLPSDPMPA